MIGILSRIFIRGNGRKDYKNPAVRKAYGTLCGLFGIFLNICLFAGKYVAGAISGSIAIMADAFNNLSDAGSSIVTLIGFWYAGKRPDEDHPFGHNRFEYISGLVVAMVIILMGFELAKSSLEKIIRPTEVDTGILAMVIMAVSIGVKGYMWFYNTRIGRKIDSAAMRATALDSLSDCVATAVVLIAMTVMKLTGVNIDGIAGIFVAMFILYTGYSAAKETISPLLGKQPDAEFVQEIRRIVLSHRQITGIHDLIVHDYGPGRVMISLHAETPGNQDIFAIHDVIDTIERELAEELGCSAVIHMDPVSNCDEGQLALKNAVTEFVKTVDHRIRIHDFRVMHCDGRAGISFDVGVPFDVRLSDADIKERIAAFVEAQGSGYEAAITVDRTNME